MSIDQIDLIRRIYRLRRDIVSDGFDDALAALAETAPIEIRRYPSGTRCWTWRIPPKWTCDEAYIETLDGERILDQSDNPLHVASYSESVDAVVSRETLLERLHVHPHLPDEPPFIFYYYDRTWAFACPRRIRESLDQDHYRVVIKSRFEPGELKVGEYFLPGRTDKVFVIATNLCHPMQVNDSLSGVATGLAVMEAYARQTDRRYGVLMTITPENIGATAWLSHNEEFIDRMIGGVFLEMTGLDQPPALQLSFRGDTEVDAVLRQVHEAAEPGAWVGAYRQVVGNDERQFNAPGVRVPMLSYSRALPWGHAERPFKAYHSSGDNLEITSAASLERSRDTVLAMLEAIQRRELPTAAAAEAARAAPEIDTGHADDYVPRNAFRGEPFLSGYNLSLDRNKHLTEIRSRLEIIDYLDGTMSVSQIARRVDRPYAQVKDWIDQLAGVGLVVREERPGSG